MPRRSVNPILGTETEIEASLLFVLFPLFEKASVCVLVHQLLTMCRPSPPAGCSVLNVFVGTVCVMPHYAVSSTNFPDDTY